MSKDSEIQGGFDPRGKTISVQGGRLYLPVAQRIVWFRNEHPEWSIVTEAVTIDFEKQFAVYRASIFDEQGRLRSTGTKFENVKGFGDWLEKAETGAVGRALAFLAYGTASALDMADEITAIEQQAKAEERAEATRQRAAQDEEARKQASPSSDWQAAMDRFANNAFFKGYRHCDYLKDGSDELSPKRLRELAEQVLTQANCSIYGDWQKPSMWDRAARNLLPLPSSDEDNSAPTGADADPFHNEDALLDAADAAPIKKQMHVPPTSLDMEEMRREEEGTPYASASGPKGAI